MKQINRSITSNNIKTIFNFRTQSPGPDGFTTECYQTFKGEVTSILLTLLPKIGREEHAQSKLDNRTIREKYRPESLVNTGTKKSNKILVK